MTHGALFNGIAGFPLAAAWAGIPTEWTVEIDPFCNLVSKKHFPHATQYTDIRECHNLPYVDIISGGFPCQPYSVAGKQLGNEDDRALWPQMLRIIREVKPTYVIGENVTGIINLALDDVLSSLEDEGYTCETFVLPAASVGAPHRRDRVWIIAYSNQQYGNLSGFYSGRVPQQQEAKVFNHISTNTNGIRWKNGLYGQQPRGETAEPRNRDKKQNAAYSSGPRLSHTEQSVIPRENGNHQGRTVTELYPASSWANWPTQSPVCGGNDGLPTGLGRNRAKQLKAYGNAIVPQVAYEIFQAIRMLEPSP